MTSPAAPDIFEYQDYRKYLVDFYTYRKTSEYGFSYRKFATKVGLGAPNYLKLVSEAARDLTPEMALRFAHGCDLRGSAADYFCDLVAFNQASTADERERWYQRLRGYPRYRQAFRLDEMHAEYHSEWYIPAIRELVRSHDFVPDSKWIAKKLCPAITARQAERALTVLLDLGLLKREGARLVQATPLVSTGPGPLGHHIVRYHRSMMDRAADAMDRIPREDREIGALTLCVTEERYALLKQRLYDLRQQLLQESEEEAKPMRVVQLNFQLFPLTAGQKKAPKGRK